MCDSSTVNRRDDGCGGWGFVQLTTLWSTAKFDIVAKSTTRLRFPPRGDFTQNGTHALQREKNLLHQQKLVHHRAQSRCEAKHQFCDNVTSFDTLHRFTSTSTPQPLTLPQPLGLVFARLRLMTSQVTDV